MNVQVLANLLQALDPAQYKLLLPLLHDQTTSVAKKLGRGLPTGAGDEIPYFPQPPKNIRKVPVCQWAFICMTLRSVNLSWGVTIILILLRVLIMLITTVVKPPTGPRNCHVKHHRRLQHEDYIVWDSQNKCGTWWKKRYPYPPFPPPYNSSPPP